MLGKNINGAWKTIIVKQFIDSIIRPVEFYIVLLELMPGAKRLILSEWIMASVLTLQTFHCTFKVV